MDSCIDEGVGKQINKKDHALSIMILSCSMNYDRYNSVYLRFKGKKNGGTLFREPQVPFLL